MNVQFNKQIKRIACLTGICLVVVGILVVGISYGRYLWEFPRQSYVFSPAEPEHISLCGSVSQEWIDGGNLPTMPEGWEPLADGAKLDFGVTNGGIDAYAKRDQVYEIRLLAGLSIEKPENLIVRLTWQDGGDTHTVEATATPIEKGSALHSTFGEGWNYRFVDSEGEQQFVLAGGALNYQNFTIYITGDVDPALLQVQVSGRFAD